jgi:CRISPR/Cas system-associated endonuclease Cas3-HD
VYSSLKIRRNKERKKKGKREVNSQNKTKVLRDNVPPLQCMLVICIAKRDMHLDLTKENSVA